MNQTFERIIDDDGTLLTLVRRSTDGYFQLSSILNLLVSMEFGNTVELGPLQEDQLLAKYGILVDTDLDGIRWITGKRMKELLNIVGLISKFKDVFENNEENESIGVNMSENKSHMIHINNNCSNKHVRNENDNSNNNVHFVNHTQSDEKMKKRSNSQHDLDLSLKKMRSVKNTIVTFNHDIDHLSGNLKMCHALPPISDFSEDDRVRLEGFLQKILFPEEAMNKVSFDSIMESLIKGYSSDDSPLNLNIPIDEHGNTPLHWLCSIANLELIENIIKFGSNRMLGDKLGESPLIKSVKSTNNYDLGTFEKLLDLLYPCIIITDVMDRTVLHHIVMTSGMAGCSSAAKYYLDILMGWIVKKQSRTIEGLGDSILHNLNLKWVINNILNAKDSNGDTCLNIASRLGNISIVESLLDYGADPYIPNNSGLRPIDFGAGTNKTTLNILNATPVRPLKDTSKIPSDSHTLINNIQSLISTISHDYEMEVTQYQEKLNSLHNELNKKRELLASSRDRLTKAKQLRDDFNQLIEQYENIQHNIKDENDNFNRISQQLGINSDETNGFDIDEYDADEPFRIEFIYNYLENKLNHEYNGDLDLLLKNNSVDSVIQHFNESDSIDWNSIPPSMLLKARLIAYQKNDKYLDNTLTSIQLKQQEVEAKFKRVLSLCLKVNEDKLDDMLDGLLYAITHEDPENIDMDEMQDFLKKHG